MNIDRIKLEQITTSLTISLLTLMVIAITLITANAIFRWDLFPPEVERLGGVIIICAFMVIVASVIINIMINIGRIADHFDQK